ncbi:MAG: trigger factor [Anaerolineae bacterium]|nr:trigger factor [Anaerolineae bacterium]
MAEELIVTTTPRDDHQLDLTIELGPERTEQALQRAARLVSKKAKIPGFRPGKAPFATVVRMYGKPALLGEIVDDLGQEVYTEVLGQGQIEPYGQAALEDVELDPAIKFKLIVPLRPTVDLGDYSDLRVEAPVVEVGDADVDALLEQARNARAAHEVVERPAELGDLVKVDIVGSVGENTIMDNQDWELTLRGESGWLPGFDEAFVGLKAGDEKEFDITYPEDSLSKYKGQTARFKVNVKEVRAKLTPELNDEFAQSLGEYATLAEYREKKLAEIKQQRETEAQNKLTDDAVEALIGRATLAYPPSAVHDTIHDMLHDMEQRMRNIGYTLEDSLRLQGKTIEQYEQELEPSAERRVKAQLVLAELFRREGLEVTDAEVEAELDRMASQAEQEETRTAIREAFGTDQGRAVIRQDLRTSKTLDRLRALVTGQATITAAPEATEDIPVAETTAAETPAAEAAESAE